MTVSGDLKLMIAGTDIYTFFGIGFCNILMDYKFTSSDILLVVITGIL